MRVQAKQHQFCSKCGKRFVFRDSAIKRIDVDGLLEWAERNYDLCPECYSAEVTQKAIKRADGYGLPRISGGSPKQNAFAIMLRDHYITANISLFQEFQNVIRSFGTNLVKKQIAGSLPLERMLSVFTESRSDVIISGLK